MNFSQNTGMGEIELSRANFLQNSAWLLGDRMIRLAGGLLLGIWLARYLGVENFGLYTYVISFVSIFAIFSTLGLETLVIRDANAPGSDGAKLLGTALGLRFTGAFLGAVAAIAFAALLQNDTRTISLIALASSAIFAQSLFVIDWLFQARSLNRLSVIAQVAAFVLTALIKIALILAKYPVVYFIGCSVIEASLAALFLTWSYRQKHGGISLRFDKVLAKNLLGESWPLILSGFAYVLYVRIDQVMVRNILGDTDAGLFSAATRLSDAWNMIPGIIVVAAFPKLLEIRRKNEGLYLQRTLDLLGLLALATIAVSVITTLLAPLIINILYGQAYAQSAPVLAISIWNSVFVAFGFAGGRWLIAEGLTRLILLRNLMGLGANVVLNLILIPIYGIVGAAISTLLAYATANLLSYVLDKRLHPLLVMKLRALSIVGWLAKTRDSK